MAEYDSLKVKDQLGRPEDKGITVKRFTEESVIEICSTLITRQCVAGDTLIWGNPTYGIWGSFKWGSVAQASFILGNPYYGILGTSQLGSQISSPVTLFVVNPNHIFKEYFRSTTFKDTGVTTADWAVVSGELSFNAAEIAQSTAVAYNDGTIVTATITITLSAGVIGDLTLQLCADGSTFETVTNATSYNFTATGTSLKFKITSAGNVTITGISISYG